MGPFRRRRAAWTKAKSGRPPMPGTAPCSCSVLRAPYIASKACLAPNDQRPPFLHETVRVVTDGRRAEFLSTVERGGFNYRREDGAEAKVYPEDGCTYSVHRTASEAEVRQAPLGGVGFQPYARRKLAARCTSAVQREEMAIRYGVPEYRLSDFLNLSCWKDSLS